MRTILRRLSDFTKQLCVASLLVAGLPNAATAQGTLLKPLPPPPEPASSSPSHVKKNKKPVIKAPKAGAGLVRSTAYPEIPDDQNRIDGPLQDVVDGATIVINNYTVRLAQLTALPVEGFGARMLAFFRHAQVICTRYDISIDPERNFTCNADGKDLADVSLSNGGADMPDQSAYAGAARTYKEKQHMIANNHDPALASFLDGTFTTDCDRNGCGQIFFARQHEDDIQLWLDYKWEPLLHNLLTNSAKLDFYYFLLGTTANNLGAYKAAQRYLDKAKELLESGSPSERCKVALPDNCRSDNLGDLIADEKQHADVYAAYEF